MGVFGKRQDLDQPGGGGSGLHLDLDSRYCRVCRRELLPWQATCDRDGGEAVPLAELPPSGPQPPPHLLDEPGDAST